MMENQGADCSPASSVDTESERLVPTRQPCSLPFGPFDGRKAWNTLHTLGINCSFSNIFFIRCFNSTCCSYCDLGGSAVFAFLFLFTWNGRSRMADANLPSARGLQQRVHDLGDSHVGVKSYTPFPGNRLNLRNIQNKQRAPECAIIFSKVLGERDIQSVIDQNLPISLIRLVQRGDSQFAVYPF